MLTLALIGAGLASLEAVNYLYYRKTLAHANDPKEHDHDQDNNWIEKFWTEELSSEELKDWIKNTISYTAINPEKGKYYSEVPFENISRAKMLKWVAYHLYFKQYDKLEELEHDHVDTILDTLEKKIEFKFQDVECDDVYFLEFGKTDLETSYKPLVLYSSLNLIKHMVYMYLRYHGYSKYFMERSGMVYFYYKKYPHMQRKTTIFIHGLGFGITPYLSFLFRLMEETDIIIPILPNISNMEFHSTFFGLNDDKMFPNYRLLRRDFESMLTTHSINEVNIIGHSFGTIIASILLKNKWINKKIDKKILIDPVCFIDGCYKTFRYVNEPDVGDGTLSTITFNKVIYNDIYVRYALQRFLYGPEYWLSNYEDLNGSDTLVILSNKDKIVASDSIYEKLRKHSIPCVIINEAAHGDLFSSEMYDDVLEKMMYHIAYCIKN